MAVHDFKSQRLFVNLALEPGASIECHRNQSHYLRAVLRLTSGDEILVFNGRDGEWRVRIEPVGKRDCTLKVIERVREQSGGPDIVYLFAPLKRARLDYMVQKATEMGVARFQPVMTRHTAVDRINLERMRANVVEAAEQCGVLRLPKVDVPVDLTAALETWQRGRTLLFADESADAAAPLSAFDGIERGSPVAVLIGPEGGFSTQERDQIRTLPETRTLSLGPRIMRADTAAVALLALVNAVIGDWCHS